MDEFGSFDWNEMSQNIQDDGQKSYKDDRYWTLSKDKDGNGAALIRFLPDTTNLPRVKLFEYSLKKPIPGAKAKWYIASSLDTIGLPDPAKEYYNKLIAEGTEEATKAAGLIKRKTSYVSNIIVVNDPSAPENNGKVFLYKYGYKLKEAIDALQSPDASKQAMGIKPKQMFNPLTGYDFILQIHKGAGGFFSYDNSQAAAEPRAVFADRDTAVAFIKENCHDLNKAVLAPENFESYDELKVRFDAFINGASTAAPVVAPVSAAPVMPTAPVSPVSPVASVAQGMPTAPIAPTAPVMPTVPVAPVAPAAPTAPASAPADDDWLNQIG